MTTTVQNEVTSALTTKTSGDAVGSIKDRVIKAFLADGATDQIDQLIRLMTPTCEWVLMFTLERFQGFDAIRILAKQAIGTRDHPKGMGMEFTNSFNTEDRICIEYIHRGTITPEGAARYGAKTGTDFEVPICLVMHVKDGKIDLIHEYLNMAQTQGPQRPVFAQG